MKCALALLLVSLAALAYAVPSIPETFQAKIKITVTSRFGNGTGSGMWAVDESAQMSLESYNYDNNTFDSFSLNRYDMGKLFRIFPATANKSSCQMFPVKDKMPMTWSWLSYTKSIGKEIYDGQEVEIWESTIGFATRRIAISNDSTPVWLSKQGTEKDTLMQFTSFSTETPAETLFAVPSFCKNPTSGAPKKLGGCMDSTTILANAQVWVDNHVGYDQGGTYMNYRTDCSGYVSYTWQAGAPGLDTSEFPDQSFAISKEELQPGDCMIYQGDHVVLFGGWTDDTQTYYTAFEETQPCSDDPSWCGTLEHSCLYPYYYDGSDFLPYRYNNFCGTSSATASSSSSSSATSYTGSDNSFRQSSNGGKGKIPDQKQAQKFDFLG